MSDPAPVLVTDKTAIELVAQYERMKNARKPYPMILTVIVRPDAPATVFISNPAHKHNIASH